METLEKEKAELKERLMHSSKKVLLEGLSKSASISVSPASPAPFVYHPTGLAPTPIQNPVSSRDSPLLLTEIAHLRAALNQSQTDKARLSAAHLQAKVDCLTPLRLPRKNTPSAPSSELNILVKQVENLKLVRRLWVLISFGAEYSNQHFFLECPEVVQSSQTDRPFK